MAFRRKLTKEERAALEKQLTDARARSRSVMRDGREFTLIRLPDRYGKAGPVGGRGPQSERLDSLEKDE